MDESTNFDWQAALTDTYHEFTQQLIEFVPQLLGAIALLLFGCLSAYLLKLTVRKLILGTEVIFRKFSHNESQSSELPSTYANIAGKIIFWSVLIFFIVAATKMLGWRLFSGWVDRLITYLPSLITGLFVILAGFLIGNTVRITISGAAASGGIEHGDVLARVVQIVILFTALVIGVEQIGIQVDFLTNIMVVIAGVLLAGGALAFSLGAKNFVANLIGVQVARKHCQVGEYLRIGELDGELVEITQTTLILDTASGRAIVPGRLFQKLITVSSTTLRRDTPDNM